MQERKMKSQQEEHMKGGSRSTETESALQESPWLKTATKEATKILNVMMAITSNYFLRFSGWFLFLVLSKIFPGGIWVGKENLEEIRSLSQQGSVLFLPTHKSYLDFILVTFVCYTCNIQAPCIAAGDNFRIPFIGWLARKHGAFFIRRKLEGSSLLYRGLLAQYLRNLVHQGANLEVFIEAARSRSGRIMSPKFGILARLVDPVLNQEGYDLYVVPVGISFDKLLDTGFAREVRIQLFLSFLYSVPICSNFSFLFFDCTIFKKI